MLGIDFLTPPRPITVAGMEFMDYQDQKSYQDLAAILSKVLVDEQVEGKDKVAFVSGRDGTEAIEELIMDSYGINIRLIAPSDSVQNAAVDSGYFLPNHILNNKGVEQLLGSDESSIGRAFRRLKVDILNGWVDTAKAKVGGDYSKVRFTLYIQRYIDDFISTKYCERHKVTMAEALASIILHEVGHIWTGFLFVTQNVVDSIMPCIAARMVINGKKYGRERSAIIHETLRELECTTRPTTEELDNMDGQALIVMFDKAIATRNIRRTLSLGTTDRASEIYADLFAARCGVPKKMIAGIANVSTESIGRNISIWCIGVAVLMATVSAPFLASISAIIGIGVGLLALHFSINPNSEYDSPYRRLKNILRDHILHIQESKELDARSKAQLVKDAKEMSDMVEEAKSFFEGTAVQRLLGWMFSGSDFKAQEFEHYTDELIAHTLSIYKDAF